MSADNHQSQGYVLSRLFPVPLLPAAAGGLGGAACVHASIMAHRARQLAVLGAPLSVEAPNCYTGPKTQIRVEVLAGAGRGRGRGGGGAPRKRANVGGRPGVPVAAGGATVQPPLAESTPGEGPPNGAEMEEIGGDDAPPVDPVEQQEEESVFDEYERLAAEHVTAQKSAKGALARMRKRAAASRG